MNFYSYKIKKIREHASFVLTLSICSFSKKYYIIKIIGDNLDSKLNLNNYIFSL
jgi:hypothetical protein